MEFNETRKDGQGACIPLTLANDHLVVSCEHGYKTLIS